MRKEGEAMPRPYGSAGITRRLAADYASLSLR